MPTSANTILDLIETQMNAPQRYVSQLESDFTSDHVALAMYQNVHLPRLVNTTVLGGGQQMLVMSVVSTFSLCVRV